MPAEAIIRIRCEKYFTLQTLETPVDLARR